MNSAPILANSLLKKLSQNRWLLAILLIAFVLRLGFMLTLAPVISGDGCEYVRMGMEIRDGKPLTGVFDWPETMYGTFYPILIAGISTLGVSAEHAAKLLALLFGTALVLIAFLLARYVYGARVAYLTAILFCLFPLFVALSGSVYNETIYLTLWLTAIYFSIKALDDFRLRHFVAAGLFFGFATLCRPEAFAYPLFVAFAAVLVAVVRKLAWASVLGGAMLMFATWFLLMLPYAVFQHVHTGQYRFEGKWNINYTLGNRINSGMGYIQAGFAIDDKLRPVGPLLDSSLYAAYTPYSHSLRDKLAYMGRVIHRNWPDAYAELFSVDFGGPVTLLLVCLGLFGSAWNAKRFRHELVLLVMGLSLIVLMITAAHLEHRYAYPLPVILLLWAAAGVVAFRDWVCHTIECSAEKWKSTSAFASQFAVIIVIFALLLFAVVGVRTDHYFTMQREGFSGIKQAGSWLAAHMPPSGRICAIEGRVAYYADTTLIIFPYADSPTVLRYLESKPVDYIVLDSQNIRSNPTFGQWYENGIPDHRARLVFESTQGTEDHLRIYSWNPAGAAQTVASAHGIRE
jgi:4-amino-4-deoxy-L-arabinose transferase-like glycosyltransferase